jgi:stress response protein YsnF
MALGTTDRNRRLQELGGSDFEIADGQPDIRGWDVKDASGQRIGEVDDLIFDTESRKVRYMKIDLEGNVLDLETRDVLVPIGLAQLHDDDDDVILNNVTADQLRSLPEYDDDNLEDASFESNIRRVFAGAGGAAVAGAALGTGTGSTMDTDRNRDSDFYNHEHFNDNNLYNRRGRNQAASADRSSEEETIPVVREELEIGKEEVERGGIRLRSRVVERPVEETVNLREENVNIERTPVDRPASEGTCAKTPSKCANALKCRW